MEFPDTMNWNGHPLFIICMVQVQRQLKTWDGKPTNQPTNLPTIFLCSLIPTILSSSLFTCILGMMGNGEGKVRRRETDGMGKTASNTKEKHGLGWGANGRVMRGREGEDWSNKNTKRMEVDYLHSLQSLISPFSIKVHADLVIWSWFYGLLKCHTFFLKKLI